MSMHQAEHMDKTKQKLREQEFLVRAILIFWHDLWTRTFPQRISQNFAGISAKFSGRKPNFCRKQKFFAKFSVFPLQTVKYRDTIGLTTPQEVAFMRVFGALLPRVTTEQASRFTAKNTIYRGKIGKNSIYQTINTARSVSMGWCFSLAEHFLEKPRSHAAAQS